MPLTIADVYLGLGGERPHPILAAAPISGFVIDSRLATPGSCFIALRGETTDGHHFIDDAIQRGAIAILAERLDTVASEHIALRPDAQQRPPPDAQQRPPPDAQQRPPPDAQQRPLVFLVDDTLAALQRLAAYWRARHHPTVIGITGSVGKTSTKELTAAVLRRRFSTLWNEGNLNNEIGLPLTLLRLETHHQYAILEMGFYVEGEIAQLCSLAHPHIGVITNVGPIHMERAGSIEAIFRGKSELVRALPPDGVAVLNWDDERVRQMAALSPAPIFRYGLNPDAELWADQIVSEGLEGIRFRFHHRRPASKDPSREDILHVHLPLLGRHAVHTALRAAAVGLLCGMAWEDIINGLRDVKAQLRIELVPGINGSTLIDDTYNASPPSTLAALNLLADLSGRRIAVLGDMLELGSYAETGHRLVGGRAADVVHSLVAVGPLSRWIAEEAIADGLPPARVHYVPTARAALPVLQSLIQPGDYVLIKGSRALGMESLVASLSA